MPEPQVCRFSSVPRAVFIGLLRMPPVDHFSTHRCWAAAAPAEFPSGPQSPAFSTPTWDQCFNMSITRGFDHDQEEWQESIQD